MQMRIGKDGLAVDVEGTCLLMSGVESERIARPSDIELFCYSFVGGIKHFKYRRRISQFRNTKYVERVGNVNAFNDLEERAYDIITLDLTQLEPNKAIFAARKAVERVVFAKFNGLYRNRNPCFSIAGRVDITPFNRVYNEAYKKDEEDRAYGAYGFRFVNGSRKENVFDLGL